MGTKRIGLKRVQALLENLKREISWGVETTFNDMAKIGVKATDTNPEVCLIAGKGNIGGKAVNVNTGSATQLYPLGAKLVYGDRTFRYGLVSGSAEATATDPHVDPGKVVQTENQRGNPGDHVHMNSTAAVSIGSYTVSVETNGTDLIENEYADGYLWVEDGTGEGQAFKVRSHPAHDHSDDPSCEITLYDPVGTALGTAANSDLSLVKNKWAGLMVSGAAEPLSGGPGAARTAGVGVALCTLTRGSYGWFQTSGPAPVLTHGTVTIGREVFRSDYIDGAIQSGSAVSREEDDGVPQTLQKIGTVIRVGADEEYSLVDLKLE